MKGCIIKNSDVTAVINKYFDTKGDTFKVETETQLLEFLEYVLDEINCNTQSDNSKKVILSTINTICNVEYMNLDLKNSINDMLDEINKNKEEESDDSLLTLKIAKSNLKDPVYIGEFDKLIGKSEYLQNEYTKRITELLVLATIYNKSKGVVKRSLVNTNIARLKNNLYRALKEYLKDNVSEMDKEELDKLPSDIYNLVLKNVNRDWNKLLTIAQKHFFGENFNGNLDEVTKFAKDIVISKDLRKIDAYFNFVMLSNRIFDKKFSDIFGDLIVIKSKFKGEVPLSYEKYSILDVSHFDTGWSANEENKEALSRVDEACELLLKNTQILDYNSGTPIQGLYLDSTKWFYFFDEVRSKIKDATVVKAFLDFNLDPLGNTITIVKYCMSKLNGQAPAELPTSLRHIARTIWDNFFDDTYTVKNKSLYRSSIAMQRSGNVETDSMLLDHLVSLVDRTLKVSYMYYGYNPDRTVYGVQVISPTNGGRYRNQLLAKIESNVNDNPDYSILTKYNVRYTKPKNKEDKYNVIFDITLKIPGREVEDPNGEKTVKRGGLERRVHVIPELEKRLTFSFENGQLVISDSEGSKYLLTDLLGDLPGDFFKQYAENPECFKNDVKNNNAVKLLELIDSLLRTDFLNGEFVTFDYFRSEVTNTDSVVKPIRNLLSLVNNAFSIIMLQLDFNNARRENPNLDFFNFVDGYLKISTKHEEDFDKFYDKRKNKLRVTRDSGTEIESLVLATILSEGDYFKGTVKGVDSNNIAKYKKTSLAYKIESIISRLRRSKSNVYAESILALNSGIIRDIHVLNGAEYNGDFKLAKEFTPGEWMYSSFMYDFVMLSFKKEPTFICMPVTYSDKTTFFKYVIDLSKDSFIIKLNGNNFKIFDPIQGKKVNFNYSIANNSDLRKAIWLNRSSSYTNMYKTVIDDTLKIIKYIFGKNKFNNKDLKHDEILANINGRFNLLETKLSEDLKNRIESVIEKFELLDSIDDLNSYEDLRGLLHLVSLSEFNNAAGRLHILASENLYYTKIGNALDMNVCLHYMANVLFNALDVEENPNNKFLSHVNRIIKRSAILLLDTNTVFSKNDLLFLKDTFKDKYGIKLSDDWFQGDVFVIAKHNGQNIISKDLLEKTPVSELTFNPIFERFILTDMLTSYDLRLVLVASLLQHPNKERSDILNALYRNYNADRLEDLLYEGVDEEKRNYSNAMLDAVRLLTNQYDLSSAKRTVNIGATVANYSRGNRLGIPKVTRRALMTDPVASTFGPDGTRENYLDAHDGGSQALMLEMVLRNLSLLGDKISGTISKSIEIDYTDSGALILDKYALHGMDNWKLRESLGSSYNLLNLTRRMMSIRFFDKSGNYYTFDELDKEPEEVKKAGYKLELTKDYYGRTIKLSSITDNLYTYDPDTNKYYKIVGFEKSSKNDPKAYIIRRIEVTNEGEEIGIEKEIEVSINCLYDMWLAFGGLYSMEGIDGKLLYTDISWHVLAAYVNSVGYYYANNNQTKIEELPNLDNTWLPLKHKYIAVLDVHSAVKNGGYGINSLDKWNPVFLRENESDEEYLERLEKDLLYMTQDTGNSGELLDATHYVDENDVDVTLPTLVMAALENGGYSHEVTKSIYEALGQLALAKLDDDLPTIFKIYQELDPRKSVDYDTFKSEVYEVLGVIGVKAARRDEYGSLKAVVNLVLDELRKHRKDHKKDKVKLPLSDSSIFMKIVADYTSNINKIAIKHKLAGFAAVISPAYGMILLYRLEEGNLTYTEVEQKAIEFFKGKVEANYSAERKVKLYLQKRLDKIPARQIAYVTPGLRIILCDEHGNPMSNDTDGSYIRYDTTSWDLYLELKNLEKTTGKKYRFKVDVTRPSDLLPMICTWEKGNVVHNYYDIPAIRKVFDIQLNNKNLTKILKRFIRDYVQSILNLLHEGEYVPLTVFESSKNVEFIKLSDDSKIASELGLDLLIAVRKKEDGELIKIKDAELIVPNQYAKKFGMSLYESLSKILASGPKYFEDQYKHNHNPGGLTWYNVCLTLSNGEHLYFVLKDSFLHGKMEVPITTEDDYKGKKTKDGYKLFRINDLGETLYEAGYFNENNEPVRTIEEYSSDEGNTVYVIDSLELLDLFLENDWDDIRINGKVDIDTSSKFAEYLSKSENTRVKKFLTLFSTINQIHSLLKDAKLDVGLSDEVKAKKKTKRLEDYEELINKIVDLSITSKLINETDKDLFKLRILRHLEGYTQGNTKRRGILDNTLSLSDRTRLVNQLFDDIYKMLFVKVRDKLIKNWARYRFAAFKKSLEYISARIPALTQLSFMKMLVVAFVPGKLNNAYVSHYQTWLLGSDYDIDKTYLIGQEFSDSGKYIAHSPLAITDSYEGIVASNNIPIPNQLIEFKVDNKKGVDISNLLSQLGNDELANLEIYIEILNKIKDGRVKFSKEFEKIGNETIDKLNKHNGYFKNKSYKQVLAILNNVAANGIQKVISSVLNFRLSHTPISLGEKNDISTPKGASTVSDVGRDAENMTLDSAFDRYLLTTHNQVGRRVIGISAIGAKVFFNMSYVLNEIAKSGNIDDFKKVAFRFNFNPLIYKDGKLQLIDVLTHVLPNINFYKLENKLDELKKLITLVESGIYSLELIAKIIENEFEYLPDLALVISQLLSAATDNAKELILSKINATDLTAGLYIHFLTLGVDFEDIAKFMTSPIVTEAVKLAEQQICIFNPTSSKSSLILVNVTKALLGSVNVMRFILSSDIASLTSFISKRTNMKPEKKEKKRVFLDRFFSEMINGNINSLDTSQVTNPRIIALFNYVDSLVKIKLKLSRLYMTANLVDNEGNELETKDIVNLEIKKLHKYLLDAQETRLMGLILNSNLGMRTNATELLLWILNVEEAVGERKYVAKDIQRLLEHSGIISKEGSEENTEGNTETEETNKKVDKLKVNPDDRVEQNPYFTYGEAKEILEEAEKYDIIDNFSFTKFMLGSKKYRDAAINYYSLVKSNHNILYMILHIPHNKSTLLLFAATHEALISNIAIYRILDPLYKRMRKEKLMVDAKKRTIMEGYIVKQFILKWLGDTSKTPSISLKSGDMYFKSTGARTYVKEGDTIDIDFSTPEGIATFKYYMESYVLNELLKRYKNNEFVKNLILDDGRLDPVTKDIVHTLIILNLNMRSELKGSKEIKYEQILFDFEKLAKEEIDGNNIVELFALYNLIVNNNKIGETNLTKLIFDLMEKSGRNIDLLQGKGGWFDFVSNKLDYGNNIEFNVDELMNNLLYYISDYKNWRSLKQLFDNTNQRYNVIAKFKGVDGEYLTYDFGSDLLIARDMSDYFLIDTPFSRLISKESTSIFDIKNNEIDTLVLIDAYSRNIIKIAFYCE